MIELVLNVCDIKFAVLSYIATSLLGYIFFPSNIISLTTFFLFFGLYPIISRLSFLFKKIGFRYVFKLIYYRKNFVTIDEIKYFNDLIKCYNCTKEELGHRIKAVYKINKYRTKEYNKELKKTLK